MKQKITDVFDYLPEELAATLMPEEPAMPNDTSWRVHVLTKRPAIKIPRLAAAAVVLVCGAALGILTLISGNYSKTQTEYIERDYASMFFTEEGVSVENKDYRLTVEEVVLKNDEKTVLVSLEALNEKSWEAMESLDFAPCLMTWWDRQWSKQLVDGDNESGWKKYYLMDFSCAGQYACTVCFAPVTDYEEYYWICKSEETSEDVGDFLSIKINVEEPVEYTAK